MGQKTDSTPTQGTRIGDEAVHSMQAINSYRVEERSRWKKRVFSFIFVGLLISLLVHFNLAVILQLLTRDGAGEKPGGAITSIEFAIQDSQTLSDMPEGEQLNQQENVQSEANAISQTNTQANLTADASTTSLLADSSTMAPSLSGGGSSGMGGGMGGSGGGTTFFGISSAGSRFCYIVDISGSMNTQNRLNAAIAELTKSLKQLPDFARFYILFYSSNVKYNIPSSQKGWNTARNSTIRKMAKEFKSIRPQGGTNPAPAFARAFELDPLPEVIYFLNDGIISPFSAQQLQHMMPSGSRIVINTISFGDSASQQEMINIAKQNQGQFKHVKTCVGKP